MAILTRSSIVAFKEETTEGDYLDVTGADFVKIREGFSMQNENETVDSDELVNDIGASASIVVGENPSASFPFYCKHSGVEGQEPEIGIAYESAFGDKTVNGTEYDTVAGSTTSVINVDAGEGLLFEEGQPLLIKDGVNGYSIRNVHEINTDALSLGFNLSSAPAAAGISLGKSILYKPAATGHPTYNIQRYQASSSAAFKDLISGTRTTSLSFEFPARNLGTVSVENEGLKYFYDYINTDSNNEYIDFTSGGNTYAVALTNKTFKTPLEVASDIATKMSASSVDTITCDYSSTDGKYTIASDGTSFTLLSNSGSNVANSIWSDIGYSVAADKTGDTSYEGDSAQSFDPAVTPSYDDVDPNVIVNNELFIGDADNNICRKSTNVSITIGTPKTQVLSICAENGVAETLTLSREVTLSAQLILEQYEAEIFDRAFNNTTTRLMFNGGVKNNSGNWTAGKCFNLYMQSAKITAVPIQDNDGYQVIALEAKGFVSGSTKDVYLGFV